MPIEDYPWAGDLAEADLPTMQGFRYIDPTNDRMYIQLDEEGQWFTFFDGYGPEVFSHQPRVPDHWVLDLRHAPTYATMCEVLAGLLGFPGSCSRISNNYPQLWTAVTPIGGQDVSIVQLHASIGLETRERVLAHALFLYSTDEHDRGKDSVDPQVEEDKPQVDRMALLMEE